MFFIIAVAAIHLTNALNSQKWLYIHPSNFNTYWDEFTVWVEGGLSYWQLDFAWGLSKERSSMEGYKVIFESWEHWWGVSQLQQWWKTPLCVSSIPKEWNSQCFYRPKQAVKTADVFGIEKVWATIYGGSKQHGDFGSKKNATGHRKFLGRIHTWEMKNFVRRWWKSHDSPEFERSIVAGTMLRMHMVSKRKSVPIYDYYVSGTAWNILY